MHESKELAHDSVLKIKLVLHEYAVGLEEKHNHQRDEDSAVTFCVIMVLLKY